MKSKQHIGVLVALTVLLSGCGAARHPKRLVQAIWSEEDKQAFEAAKQVLGTVDEFCRQAREGFYGIPIPLTVAGTVGGGDQPVHQAYAGLTIASITDGIGNVFIVGSGAGARVDLLANWEGNVFVCSADITAIKGRVLGNVFVAHGDVGTVEGLEGNLFIRSGYLKGEITKSQGMRLVENPNGKLFFGLGNALIPVN
jgi:hypothetical protein